MINNNNANLKSNMEFPLMSDNNFLILACFTRSFDESHINNGRCHLISSIVLSRYILYNNEFKEALSTDSSFFRDMVDKNNTKFIFRVVFNMENEDRYKITDMPESNIKEIVITYDKLIGCFLDENTGMFSEIFGRLDEKYKNNSAIYTSSLFVFQNVN